ncbi:MAG: phosphonate C-P lyase system protein PhnG [Chromatiales bacterium]|nr:phosphonate C-P lyase system protein PhnG [Chromatiales bacterium]
MTEHSQQTPVIDIERRKRWMGAFAKARLDQLEASWEQLADKPGYDFIKRPEIGQVMVRARMGGVGRQFNLGEMTMSRCVVRLADGTMGFGYTSDNNRRHAELAAIYDALMQDGERRKQLEPIILQPLVQAEERHKCREAVQTASTKVDFFTMVRGDD